MKELGGKVPNSWIRTLEKKIKAGFLTGVKSVRTWVFSHGGEKRWGRKGRGGGPCEGVPKAGSQGGKTTIFKPHGGKRENGKKQGRLSFFCSTGLGGVGNDPKNQSEVQEKKKGERGGEKPCGCILNKQ